MNTREQTIQAIKQNPNVSVLVIGGGINGIGVFRDLAANGVDVLLVEKGDYCSGTSAASTRVIHGGLRYLENGEFRLVREALKERALLLKNAPHYVGPLPTTIPIDNWTGGMLHAASTFLGIKSKPGSRGAAVIKLGLTMYDTMAGSDSQLPRHRFQSREAARQQRPLLNPDVVTTVTYYDARVYYPERLGLELVMDAQTDNPNAHALNYAPVVNADGATIIMRDDISGEEICVQPKLVVNATGAWIDLTNSAMQRPTEFIGGTKGSHLVLDHPELLEATQGEMLYFINQDGRICIFYPFYDKVIAGSTDLPVKDPDSAYCDDDETDYILDSIRMVFPKLAVGHDDIVFKFSGVRPLPSSNALTAGQISRDHSIRTLDATEAAPYPVYSLVGGKWTTYRAFAEQVTNILLEQLSQQRTIDTATLPIGGGADYARTDAESNTWLKQVNEATRVPTARLNVLLDRYGTYAAQIAEYISAGEDAPLQHHTNYSRREIEFLAAQEQLGHLDDIILRRTLIGMLGELTPSLLRELADIAAVANHWDEERKAAEITHVETIFATRHGVDLRALTV